MCAICCMQCVVYNRIVCVIVYDCVCNALRAIQSYSNEVVTYGYVREARCQRYYVILSLSFIRCKIRIEWCDSALSERSITRAWRAVYVIKSFAIRSLVLLFYFSLTLFNIFLKTICWDTDAYKYALIVESHTCALDQHEKRSKFRETSIPIKS